MKNLMFNGCTIGIQVDNGFTANVLAPTFTNVGQSVVFNSGSAWLSVIDATSTNSGDFFTSNEEYPNFMLENIKKDTTNSNMVTVSGNVLVAGETSIGTYVYGNTYGATPVYQTSPSNVALARPTELAPSGSYPIFTAPQYPDATIDDVINLKDSAANGGFNLYGNDSVDETAALQGALNTAASAGKIAYLPFGIYRVLSTVTVPIGTKLVGNGWSTISGYGDNFSDESNPVAVVQVGAAGDVGTASIQDIRFTVGQQLPGAIILQVNMAGNTPGDVAIHNSLITVGGTRDTEIDCSSEANCRAAYNGLHLTASSSAYVDNFWAWVADHASDGSSGGINIAAKGGILVEATKGTWLAGVGSEHWWLYQLAFNGASNVFTSLFQSETNYHQGSSAAIMPPGPFTPVDSDPTFSWCTSDDNPADCAMGAAQYFNGGSNIFGYGAASWNFNSDTQSNMNVINQAVTNLHLYGLTDHAATDLMRLPDGTRFGNGASGGDGYGGSWGSLAAEYST
nr:glucan endo-1,3-beta-glucosidase bgn13.1 [Quercus suber]